MWYYWILLPKQNTGLIHIGLRNSLITKILRTFFALILTFCILPENVQSQEMRVYSQGPGYRFLPQKQYNGIPVTIYNDSSKTYRNQFTLNIEIDGVADSFTLDSLLADQDSTIIFKYYPDSPKKFKNSTRILPTWYQAL